MYMAIVADCADGWRTQDNSIPPKTKCQTHTTYVVRTSLEKKTNCSSGIKKFLKFVSAFYSIRTNVQRRRRQRQWQKNIKWNDKKRTFVAAIIIVTVRSTSLSTCPFFAIYSFLVLFCAVVVFVGGTKREMEKKLKFVHVSRKFSAWVVGPTQHRHRWNEGQFNASLEATTHTQTMCGVDTIFISPSLPSLPCHRIEWKIADVALSKVAEQ